MSENKRKFLLLAFLAVIITLIAYEIATEAQDTANTALQPPPTACTSSTFLQSFSGNTTVCNSIPGVGTLIFYLYNTSIDGYRVMNTTLPDQSLPSIVNTTSGLSGNANLVGRWQTPPMNITGMPAGIFNLVIDANQSQGLPGSIQLYFVLTTNDTVNNTEEFDGMSQLTQPLTATETRYILSVNEGAHSHNLTDAHAVYLYANISSPSPVTLKWEVEGDTLSRVEAPSFSPTTASFVPYTNATRPVDITPFTINASGFNAFGDSDFNRFNISNTRNIIGDHLHIITNASVDDYFNTFSAGNSTNISSIRVSSNATTIASMEQCNGGCHARNISWIRVWSSFIDISSPNVYFTGNASFSGNVLANNVNSSYYREFWQKQGTVVQGTWSWMNDSNQVDYSSVTGEPAGAWGNTNIQNDEYKWNSIFLTSGTYKVTYTTIKFPNGGIIELLFGSTSIGTLDTYNSPVVYNIVATTTFSLSSPATADLRIRSTTKNASSGGYGIRFSRIQLEKIG